MTTVYICSSCRRSLHPRVRRLFATQWLANAGFHSFVDLVPPPLDEKQLPGRISPKQQPHGLAYDPVEIKFDKMFVNQEALKKRSRYSTEREASDEELAARFSITTRKFASEDANDANAKDEYDENANVEKHMGKFEPASRLSRMLSNGRASGSDIWEMFLQTFPSADCSALRHPPFGDPSILENRLLCGKLIKIMTTKWLRREESGLPTPTQILQKLHDLHMLNPESPIRSIWRLNSVALHKIYVTGASSYSFSPLVEQILSLWALFFRLFTKASARSLTTSRHGPLDWSGLPEIVEDCSNIDATLEEGMRPKAAHPVRTQKRQTNSIAERLVSDLYLFPKNLNDLLATSALATLTTLTHRLGPGVTGDNYEAGEPFMRYLFHRFHGLDLMNARLLLYKTLADQERPRFQPEHLKAIGKEVLKIPPRITAALGIGSLKVIDPNSDSSFTSEESGNLEEELSKKINQRVARNDTRQLLRLWAETKDVYTMLNINGSERGVIPPKLYAAFLDAFGLLNRPDMADVVWNHMVERKILPSVQHWGALMKGRGKRYKAAEEIWANMKSSGIQPDVHIWTTRIHILLSTAPTPDRGLFAMDEMGRAWLKAVTRRYGKANRLDLSTIGDLSVAVKPNVATLNAAVTALASRKKQDRELFPRIFAWAAQFAIKPNERTYNALIKECLAERNLGEAMKILGRMEEQGVQPDGATFGMFINHVFRQQQQASGEPMNTNQQEEMLASILQTLDERGMESDPYTMGLLFDILVKQYQNLPAAQKVLEYMAKKGMKPSPHIYTILVTHHFQKANDENGPGIPDFPAIEALWNHIQITGGTVDNIFYDRMIEGYARAGEPGEAMMFLGRMGREAKRPGWQALYMLIKSLADNGMMDRVREVVDDVENFEGNIHAGVRGYNSWGAKFWDFAVECGIRTRPGNQLNAPIDEDANWLEGFRRREAERGDMDAENDVLDGVSEAGKSEVNAEKSVVSAW
jgi:pentatricopeptide repeat protein